VSKDLTARSRIIAHLSTNGAIVDDGGRATAVLKDAVDYDGSSLAFIQLVSAMERAGQIRREVRGKRTYRIEAADVSGFESEDVFSAGDGDGRGEEQAVPSAASAPSAPAAPSEFDYDELAGALLARVSRVLSEPPARESGDRPILRRKLDQLGSRVTELERQLARTRADRDAVASERDELRRQLDAASHNLSLLTERLGNQRRPTGGASSRLDSEERALLYRLSRDRRDEAS